MSKTVTAMKTGAKTRLLRAAAKIVIEKGFNDTGLQEVLDAAQVPKGSFYFYFKSKEDFGLQLIGFYADFFQAKAEELFAGTRGPYVEKIQQFLDWQGDFMEANGFRGGCPFGNLAQEMADRNEKFRKKIKEVFDRQRESLAHVLILAKKAGEVAPGLDPQAAAELIICSWQGALIQMKVCQNPYSRKVFKRAIFQGLLAPPESPQPSGPA